MMQSRPKNLYPKTQIPKWKNKTLWALFLVPIALASVFVARRFESKRIQQEVLSNIASVPSPVKILDSKTQTPVDTPQKALPDEVNFDVPFTSQAPTGNWDAQHEENCEEATLLMANRYLNGRNIEGAPDAEEGMAEIVAFENDNLGVSDSTDAEQTARVAREFLNLKTEIIMDPTIDQIKKAITDNQLVLVPAAGRELGNPFYKQPGPLYHMVVIKGYTASEFITNDPGTKRGENYPYLFDTLLNANRDWNGGDVANGSREVIIVSK